MNLFAERIFRAVNLDAEFYREVKEETATWRDAAAVVALSSLAAGIGSLGLGPAGFLAGTMAAFAGWLIWSLVIYLLGVRIRPEAHGKGRMGQLLRVLAFASAPGLIRFLAVIPALGMVVILASSIWTFLAMIVATRQALDSESRWRPVMICLLGWVTQGLVVASFLSTLTLPRAE